MPQPLTKKEARDLEKLLTRVIASGRWWPNEKTFQLAHGITSAWAPELVITRVHKSKKEILLTKYGGGAKWFSGMWHIPGGYDSWKRSDIQADCTSIAKRELGIDVKYVKILDIYKWKPGEHPYGRPLSLYVECVPKKKIIETEAKKFFPVQKLPEKVVPCQKNFVKKYFTK